jgi:hypothetical protein
MLQTNSLLSVVYGAGDVESWDGPGLGPEKWAGSVECYLREGRKWIQTVEGSDVVLDRVLLVEVEDPAVDWRIGDTVAYTKTGGILELGKVAIVQRPTIDDPDIPSDVITTRLTLTAR